MLVIDSSNIAQVMMALGQGDYPVACIPKRWTDGQLLEEMAADRAMLALLEEEERLLCPR